MTISPISREVPNPPAEPVLMTKSTPKRSIKIPAASADITFPIPDWTRTIDFSSSVPSINSQLATVVFFSIVISSSRRRFSSSIAAIIPNFILSPHYYRSICFAIKMISSYPSPIFTPFLRRPSSSNPHFS